MYKVLHIGKFRLLENVDIALGSQITVIAGRNSTGKSTILGMLANSCELEAAYKTYQGKRFKAEFSEIFKGSKDFDPAGSHRLNMIVDMGSGDSRVDFRTTWQKYSDGSDRFRIIPKRIANDGKETESKLEIPVIYLGLSRLFPIGEANYAGLSTKQLKWVTEEDEVWFTSNYKKILPLHDEITFTSKVDIGRLGKKLGIGINTETYPAVSNSAGQDNLGQILLSVLSFKKLKREFEGDWPGGLLIIDEIDATLHPFAQEMLLNLLKKECRQIGIQVIFTTHSVSMLEQVCCFTSRNPAGQTCGIEHYYFTTANGKLDVRRNPSFASVRNDLTISAVSAISSKIGIFSEDAEARWMIKGLLDGSTFSLSTRCIEASFGKNTLLHLYAHDFEYVRDRIVVFDGDVGDDDLGSIPSVLIDSGANIVNLPGSVRPEQLIYEYLIGLEPDHELWMDGMGFSFTKDLLEARGPMSDQYESRGVERNRYKAWFNDNKVILDSIHVLAHWSHDNPAEHEEFCRAFSIAYEAVAARTSN